MNNPMLMIDGYKLDHRRQYPKGTTRVYSNWTPRSSRIIGQNKVVFFGLRYVLVEYLIHRMQTHFFNHPVNYVLNQYKELVDNYLGPNDIGVEHIRWLHGKGYLPLSIKAVPEGTLVPLRQPMFTIENTDPDGFWLPNYFETLLSSLLYGPCTSATTAHYLRCSLDRMARLSGGDLGFVPYQGHDFSFRGMMGPEAAALSGAGHLLSFLGTDTIPAVVLLSQYYNMGKSDGVGASVPATEHSVMCAGGKDDELETFSRLLDLYPKGILSVVSDTWDLWHVLTDILPKLKDKILAREGKLVIRPDSGDPVKIICGNPDSLKDSPEYKGVLRLLAETFGAEVKNDYWHLSPKIGVIYGDGINHDRALKMTSTMRDMGFASTNIVLGIGSYTYQYVTRDTYGFAMKATWVEVDGQGKSIYKTPKTDDGIKNSARGRLCVYDGRLIENATPEDEKMSDLKEVFHNGHITGPYPLLSDIRNRLALARE